MDNTQIVMQGQSAISQCPLSASVLLGGAKAVLSDYDFVESEAGQQDGLSISPSGMVRADNPHSCTVLKLLEVVPSLNSCTAGGNQRTIEKTDTGFREVSRTGAAQYWDRLITLDGQVLCVSRHDGADWPCDQTH